MPGTQQVITQAAANIVDGQITLGDLVEHPLVASSVRCKRIWIGAGAANQGNVLVGIKGSQHRILAKGNSDGFYVHLDDASKLYLKAASAGDVVLYWIEC